MKNIICVSQKSVCVEDFFVRVEKIMQEEVFAFILREKELSKLEYEQLAKELQERFSHYNTPLFLNGDFELACKLNLPVQLPFFMYEKLSFSPVPVGISIHSVEEAHYIANTKKDIAISHIIAGHIFVTDCKKGLEPRGLEFLQRVCKVLSEEIPVFGIGGISPDNIKSVRKTGAKGGAIMSSCMKVENVQELLIMLR